MKTLVYDAGCDADPGDPLADPPRGRTLAQAPQVLEMWPVDATEAVANGKGRYSLSPPADDAAVGPKLRGGKKADDDKPADPTAP